MDPEAESEMRIAAALEMKSRVILVDGFNVLHAVLLGKEGREGWWKRAPRERLLARVGGWQGGADNIWVAFDGDQPALIAAATPAGVPESRLNQKDSAACIPKSTSSESEPTETSETSDTSEAAAPTIYSLFVESADDWIVRRARRTEHPERVVVVSADRKVAGRAKSAGCEVWSPWTFISGCEDLEARDPV